MNRILLQAVIVAGLVLWLAGCSSVPSGSGSGPNADEGNVAYLPTGYDGRPVDPSQPARLWIIAPQADEMIKSAKLDVFFRVDNYELANQGNSIHVVLDNQPCRAHFSKSAPMVFDNLAEGGHTIRAFLATPKKVSLKNPEAFAQVHFYVKRKDFQNYISPVAPTLTYNEPTGTLRGEEAQRVLFDFILRNAPLGPDQFKVRYTVDGQTQVTTDYKPHYLENLPSGDHTITVELLDCNDKLAPGLFNKVTRTFQVFQPVEPPSPVPTPPEEEIRRETEQNTEHGETVRTGQTAPVPEKTGSPEDGTQPARFDQIPP